MSRFRPSTLFIYGLGITILSLLSRELFPLIFLNIVNTPIGIYLGIRKRLKLFILLFFIGLVGLFLNSIVFSNTGHIIIKTGYLTIRSNALINFLKVSLRLSSILGAALIFVTQVNIREFIRALESEFRLPKDIAFATSVGIRMLKVIEKDSNEIQLIRIERGYRKYPITPSDLKSFLRPLLSLGLERAKWIGIAAELRGFARRKAVRYRIKYSINDYLVFITLGIQAIIIILYIIL